MTALYLHAVHTLTAENVDEKTLRLELKARGVDVRRLSKFTQLALLGALSLKAKPTVDELPPETNIYLASSFNSPSKFDKMFTQLMTQNLPSPLDFMANINNAATFQIAQTLGLSGNSIFLVINEQTALQPLLLAWNDLQFEPYKRALIGWAVENSNGLIEGCVWWLAGIQEEGALAEVRFNGQKLTENRPHFLSRLSALTESISFRQQIVL